SQTMTSGPPFVWMRIAFVMSCLHVTRWSEQASVRILQREQPAFGRQSVTTGVAANMRNRNNPMARDDQGNRIAPVGLANRACASARLGGDVPVTAHLTV